jgi:hypothetical protein
MISPLPRGGKEAYARRTCATGGALIISDRARVVDDIGEGGFACLSPQAPAQLESHKSTCHVGSSRSTQAIDINRFHVYCNCRYIMSRMIAIILLLPTERDGLRDPGGKLLSERSRWHNSERLDKAPGFIGSSCNNFKSCCPDSMRHCPCVEYPAFYGPPYVSHARLHVERCPFALPRALRARFVVSNS